ncbi:hypothetical protein DES53_105328 [Roseimicrobium gellanilyticum]|uniref:PH (Pleckstrin Homology) domain-containing protein n=1 Tax=Roseimicrobium gellanilyticum TaxID=748857 RepID=A0A366HLW5_9BACT|nr:hypothetical protein [Roseimicrobium gellanilyticum]RBP43929.1 hypothetical protein DES53_105328 [Roseimicrobium gellanilyticum]
MTSPPEGFQIIEYKPRELLVLEYRSTGMGCMLVFLSVLILGLGGGFLIAFVAAPDQLTQMFTSTWWAALAGVGGALSLIHFSFFVISHLFGSTRMTATRDALVITKSLCSITRSKQVSRLSMESLEQVKDGGEGEDSFPSWGLVLKTRSNHVLLERQPIAQSDWLGLILADWFGIPYRAATIRK